LYGNLSPKVTEVTIKLQGVVTFLFLAIWGNIEKVTEVTVFSPKVLTLNLKRRKNKMKRKIKEKLSDYIDNKIELSSLKEDFNN